MSTITKRITKSVDFCAAHAIKGAGKCERNHGHNWRAIITVDQISGELDPRGFIVDVRDLKESAFKYDHDDLNNYFEYPSTENVAQKIADDALETCKENNSGGVYIVNVHLIETEHNSANASASNFAAQFPTAPNKTVDQQTKEALDKESAYAFGGQLTPPPSKAKFVRRETS